MICWSEKNDFWPENTFFLQENNDFGQKTMISWPEKNDGKMTGRRSLADLEC